MKKILFCTALLFWSVGAFALSQVDDLAEDISRDYISKTIRVVVKKRMAVLDFENVTPLMKKHNVGATVGALLTDEMGHSTIFRLVERKGIQAIMKELEFSMTGAVDQGQALKAGELSGADLLLTGTVSDNGETITIAARIVSTEKGEVVAAKTVTVQREEMIKSADEVYWSAFQSEYGISISIGSHMIIPTAGRGSPVGTLEVGYKPWRYLRVGGGLISGKLVEFRSENYRINSSYLKQTGVSDTDFALLDTANLDADIQHNYHINLTMMKFFVEGLLPISRRFILGARFEYLMASDKMVNIEQEIHGFPVPASLDINNNNLVDDFVEQRIVVNAAPHFTQMFNPQVTMEYLISKRLSLNLKVGYLIASDIEPIEFYTADDNRNTGDTDASGIFPRYPYYNFARDNEDKRVTANISGVNFSLSIAIHI